VKSWLKHLSFTVTYVWLAGVTALPVAFGAPKNVQHLASGEPGCWKLIRQAALTSDEVKQLPKACREMRDDYFASIESAKADPKTYEKKLVDALNKATKPKAPYEAIFFATLIHSENLKRALEKRAGVEQKLAVPFAYATVATYRLSGKDCEADVHYKQKAYVEICAAEDSILPVFAGVKRGSKK
jgi:hypothetical protein